MPLNWDWDSISKRVNGLRDGVDRAEGRNGENVARHSARIIRPDSMVLRTPKGMELTITVS